MPFSCSKQTCTARSALEHRTTPSLILTDTLTKKIKTCACHVYNDKACFQQMRAQPWLEWILPFGLSVWTAVPNIPFYMKGYFSNWIAYWNTWGFGPCCYHWYQARWIWFQVVLMVFVKRPLGWFYVVSSTNNLQKSCNSLLWSFMLCSEAPLPIVSILCILTH